MTPAATPLTWHHYKQHHSLDNISKHHSLDIITNTTPLTSSATPLTWHPQQHHSLDIIRENDFLLGVLLFEHGVAFLLLVLLAVPLPAAVPLASHPASLPILLCPPNKEAELTHLAWTLTGSTALQMFFSYAFFSSLSSEHWTEMCHFKKHLSLATAQGSLTLKYKAPAKSFNKLG